MNQTTRNISLFEKKKNKHIINNNCEALWKKQVRIYFYYASINIL